jgi:hypothetical protein
VSLAIINNQRVQLNNLDRANQLSPGKAVALCRHSVLDFLGQFRHSWEKVAPLFRRRTGRQSFAPLKIGKSPFSLGKNRISLWETISCARDFC